jgi:hypothetical protein
LILTGLGFCMRRLLIAAMWMFAALGVFAADCRGQTTQPGEIFDHVLNKYDSMTSYSTEGTITADNENWGMKVHSSTTLTIKIKKPNQYLITWSQVYQMMPGLVQSGAVWNDGSGPYLYMSDTGTYCKMRDDDMALGIASSVTGAAANTIRSLFLPDHGMRIDVFSGMEGLENEGSEQIDGDDCYRISGSSITSKKVTYWISKSTYLVRKFWRSLELPTSDLKAPEMTDQQLDDALKAMGQDVTAASRQQMRDAMKRGRESAAQMKGSQSEVYTKIGSPDFKAADFDFKVPEGVKLGDSPFGGGAGSGSGARMAPSASEPEGGL